MNTSYTNYANNTNLDLNEFICGVYGDDYGSLAMAKVLGGCSKNLVGRNTFSADHYLDDYSFEYELNEQQLPVKVLDYSLFGVDEKSLGVVHTITYE